ncbi:MAG: RNA-binding S4 domain-containing protein [Xanthobacteraceae bacterium]|nr:MAG: RNA-binding S4 domain-containing protein [Xanthobacteraceae bacterium]
MSFADRQRIDKWVWHARFVRTRVDAQSFIASGHVRLNGVRVTAPAHAVRAGDVLTMALDSRVRVVRVVGFSERRGNAAQAQLLYADLAPARRAYL